MINENELLKKLRLFSVVQPLLQASRLSKLKLANQIYSKRHIRDISKFIRQNNDIIRKTKQGGDQKRIKTQQNQSNKRYDDNQLKELSFQFQSVKQKYLTDQFPFGFDTSKFTAQNLEAMNRKRQAYRNKLNQANKFNLKKRVTMIGNNNLFQGANNNSSNMNVSILNPLKLNRLKSLSVYSHTSNQSPQLKAPLSPTRLRKRGNTIVEQPQIKISLKQDQIQKALNNIINLINTEQSRNYFIHRELIYGKIEQKYKLKISILEEQQQYKHMRMSKIENQKKYQTQIPYCEFNNLKDSRASIDRIFNMPIKASQRIGFKLYDRNGNGVIDEKDIIELFTIAQEFPAMQQDMEIIVKNYKVVTNTPAPEGRSSKSPRKTVFKKHDISDFSIDKINKFQVIQENDKSAQDYSSGKFRKSNYFTFKETKQQFFKGKKTSSASAISLTWDGFQQAFGNSRPQIYYDLLDFLFNIDSQLIYQKATKMASEHQAKSNRFMLFHNSDGKSESGSNYNLQVEADTQRKLIKKRDKSTITKTSKKTKTEISSEDKEMTSKKIGSIIYKAKAIQQFESLKYNN